jgi:LCP family protein required for cell wall assembly
MVKKIFLILICINLVLIIGAVAFTASSYKKIVVKPKTVAKTDISPTPTTDPQSPYSVLLLGYGGGAHEGGELTDSIIVAKVQPKLKKVTLISIPRDLWVPIPINGDQTKSFKINAAYQIGDDDKRYSNKKEEFTGAAGGGELAKYVVSKVVGFPVNYFVALDFAGFTKTVDILGGIDVKVERTFDDPWYPIEKNIVDTCGKSDEEVKALTATMSGDKLEHQFTCRYERLHFNAGIQHMNGVTALKYARSRHSNQDGGDFNRAARQRNVIASVKERVLSVNFIPKIIPFVQTLTGNMKTDIDLNKMQELVGKASDLGSYTIDSVALTSDNVLKFGTSSDGQSILMPRLGETDWTEIHQYINDPVAFNQTKTATQSAKPTTSILK